MGSFTEVESKSMDGFDHIAISLIIPCYNGRDSLNNALVSATRQSLSQIEIIVVDDGSQDGSGALMDRWAKKDPRISVIHKANEGYGASVNRGIRSARGRWIAILEADDSLTVNFCQRLLACAEAAGPDTAGPDVVRCAYLRIFEGARTQEGTPFTENTGHGSTTAFRRPLRFPCPYKGRIHLSHAGHADIRSRIRSQHGKPRMFSIEEAPELLLHHPAIWAGMYRRDYLVQQNIFFVEAPGGAWVDNPFMLESLCRTSRIAYTDEALYLYREHSFDDARRFINAHPGVALERINDMVDVCERLRECRREVLDAVALRAVNYALMTSRTMEGPKDMGAGAQEPLRLQELQELCRRTLQRIDPDNVYNNAAISREGRELYAELTATEPLRSGAPAHLEYTLREAYCRIRSAGIVSTLALARARRDAR